MKKHQIERTCIKTRKKDEKENLWRFIICNEKIVFDKEQHLKGRGFYLSKDKKLLDKKIKFNKKTYELESALCLEILESEN